MSDPVGQKFYALECARSNWGVRELRRQVIMEYAMRGITNRIFVSRYQLYLPDKEQLRRELAYAIEAEEGRRGSRQVATKKKGGGK